MHKAMRPAQFTVKVRARWGRVVLVSIGLLFGLAMIGVIVAGMLAQRAHEVTLYLLALLLILLCAAAIAYLRWQLVGMEHLRMDPEGITRWISGSPISGRHVIRWHELEGIQHAQVAFPMWWMEQWGLGGGRIVLHHSGRRARFGMDLGPEEAEVLLGRIREAVDRRCNVTASAAKRTISSVGGNSHNAPSPADPLRVSPQAPSPR